MLQPNYKDIHQDIVAQCRAGNRHAQYQLYQLYAKPMLNVSMRILNNQQEAEDVLQDAFVDVFTRLQEFRGDATFGAWLKRIVVNKSINAWKKKKLSVAPLEGQVMEQPEVLDEVQEFPFTIQQVQEALEELPEGYRLVFNLYLFEGYGHKEIANELGISESTSKSQYNRSKKKIRTILNTKYPHYENT